MLIIESSHTNNYLLKGKHLLLVHPYLKEFISGGKKIDEEQTTSYYYKKYIFLKTHLSIDEQSYSEIKPSSLYTANNIKIQIENLKAISIEITDRCNMKCEYCGYSNLYEQYGITRNKGMINENIIFTLIAELNKFWENSFEKKVDISFYGGEPLLGMSIIKKVVSFLDKKYTNIIFSYKMTTNGLLLSKHIDFLVKYNFNLSISLDGNKYHNSYRKLKNGKESHEYVVEELLYVKNKYPDFYRNNIHVSAVLHNLNRINEIQDYIKKELNLFVYIGSLNINNIKNKERFSYMHRNKDGYFEIKNQIKEVRPNEKHLNQFVCKIIQKKT